jgi:hypothetical protein
MSKKIDRIFEEAGVLLTTVKNLSTELAEVGVTAEKVTGFENAIATLREKDAVFHESKKQATYRYTEQKVKVKTIFKLLNRFRQAAEIVFHGDKATLKAYMVGKAFPTNISELTSLLTYVRESAKGHLEALMQNGIKQSDYDDLTNSLTALVEMENQQEDAKHVRSRRFAELESSAKELNVTMYKIRKAAGIRFQNAPEILLQFKPVTYRKSSTKTETTETTTETGTNT